MRTRAATSDFTRSFLLLRIEYYYDNNQLIKIKSLIGDKKQNAGPKLVTLLVKVIKIGEMVLMQTQT